MSGPTIRSLAQALGLSRSTVSEALRGSSQVSAETIRIVRAHADKCGYRINPLTSNMMSELRRSRQGLFRGMLAVVNLAEPDRPQHAAGFFRELIRGATERSEELGFGVEQFLVGEHEVTLHRLDTILSSRGILGVILLPTWADPDFTQLDWSRYAGVYTDYIIEHPALHAVCSDHYRSMIHVMQRIRSLGYRRPGLFLQKHHDERLHHRWEGAFLAFEHFASELTPIPPLVEDRITPEVFKAWFREHSPDVVLGHETHAVDWMTSCGAEIPDTHGFVSLNLLMRHRPCAGLDLQPTLLGTRAAEMVIAQLQRSEFGIPAHPSLTTIPAEWEDGPTLRAKPRAPERVLAAAPSPS